MIQFIRVLGLLFLLCSGWAHAQRPNPLQLLREIEGRVAHGVTGVARGVQQGVTGVEHGVQQGVTGIARGVQQGAAGIVHGAPHGAPGIIHGVEQGITGVERGVQQGATGIVHGVEQGANTIIRATVPEFAQIAACLETTILDGKPIGLPPPSALANHPKDYIVAIGKEVSSVLHSGFPQIMESQIQWLRQGFTTNPAHGDLVKQSIEGWKRFARMHPRASCMVPLVEKFQPALEAAALELKDDLERDFKELYHQHVEPALHDAIGKGLSTLITGKSEDGLLLTKQELADVASGVYAKYLIQQLQNGASIVNNFQGTLGKPASQGDPLPQVQKILSPDEQWPELFRLELGVEIVRAMGHKFIDSNKPPHGGFLVNQAVGLFQLSEGTIEKIGEGICGLIPEAGAAICAVAEVALDALWNQGLVPTMRWGIKQGLHALLDKEIDDARNALATNKTLENFRQSNSPLNGIATLLSKDLINSVADQHLKDVRVALNTFNSSVSGLAVSADRYGRPR